MTKLSTTILLAALATAGPARAGVYADDLSRCLVERTTREDRLALVRWMFTAASAHPAVADVSRVTPQQVDAANQTIGTMFMRLLTESCVDQARKAIEYEGPSTFAVSFQVLGQVAGTEMFNSPEVAKVMAGLEKYTDKAKLEALVKK